MATIKINSDIIEAAKSRLSRNVPEEFVLKDATELHLIEGMRQIDIYEFQLVLCELIGLSKTWPDSVKGYYPSKKLLEENKVFHMDCRDGIPLCAPYKPKGVLTDYPYGMDFQSNMRKNTPKFQKILNDDKPFLDQWIRQSYKVLQPDSFFITFYRWDLQDELFWELSEAGFKIKNQLVWNKKMGGMGDLTGSFGEQHENAVFATKGNYKFPKHAGRPWNYLESLGGAAKASEIVHPNEKPQCLIQRLVRDLTEPGEMIIEPFSGSGTTLAACVAEGRKCIAFELDDRPVAKIGCNYIEYGNKRAALAAQKGGGLW